MNEQPCRYCNGNGWFYSEPEFGQCGCIENPELPEGYEIFDGKPLKVLNPERRGWWRFHDHYDRHGYCDNPARGY